MKTLVIGGSGTVGSNLVRELLARKVPVRVLTRDAKHAPAGVDVAVGNLQDPMAIAPAFEGMEAVFLLTTLSMSETHEGMMAISAAMAAKVRRLVFMSVQHLDRHILIPHFATKLPLETAVKAAGIPYTILRPNSFMQNDVRYRDAMLGMGIYPQPLGDVGASRVDVRDIAEVAALVLTQDGHEGKTYDLCGSNVETGARIAEIWTAALGRAIRYFGNDLDAWGKMMLQFMPPWLVFDLQIMFREFGRHGLVATAEEVATFTKLLGHAPRTSEALAKETAAEWSATAKA